MKHLVLVDQLTKLGAAVLLKQTISLIPGILELNFLKNTGISFGFLSGLDSAGMGRLKLGLFLLTLVIYLYYKFARYYMTQSRINAMELILAGAVGNLLDRFLYGGVIDFLTIKLFDRTLFTCNVADIYLTFGVIMFFFSKAKQEPKRPESFKDILFKEDDL